MPGTTQPRAALSIQQSLILTWVLALIAIPVAATEVRFPEVDQGHPDFRLEQVASGLSTPWGMTFLDADLNNINAFAEYTCLADKTGGKILYLDNLRCGLEYYTYNLEEECMFFIPHMERVNCWGPAVKNLWAIFPER